MNFTLTAEKAKTQAKMLATYLAGINRKVQLGNALEAVAQMYGAKSWNVLSAGLEGVTASSSVTSPQQAPAPLYFLVENGQRVPSRVTAEVHSDDHRATTKFDAARWFMKASDNEILALAAIDWSGREEADVVAEDSRRWDVEVEAVFTYLEAANDLRNEFSDSIGFEVSVDEDEAFKFLRAFRYPLFVQVALQVSFGSQAAAVKHGFLVEQRKDQKWVYCATHHHGDTAHDTEAEAWTALGVYLERFPHEWTESRLNRSNRVKNGSGTTVLSEVTAAEPVSTANSVLGRADDETGAVLVLKPGAPHLSKEALRIITNEGDFYLQIAVPVALSTLIDQDIEFLNDEVSEAITGHSCDLTDLSFERFTPPNEAALIDTKEFVFIRVTAGWSPMDGMDDEEL